MIPKTIGRYEVKAEIGRGGMATVYRGFDPHFKREVAVKVLPREFLHDPQFRARFEREAEVIAALEHPAIVPVYDFGAFGEEGQPYIVMRLMTGGSLADRLIKGPLSVTETARLLSRLAPALDKAHTKGIIHRDLKPSNILFDDDDNPYISDFGIAKLTESAATFTGSGVVGTPAYMSPEQARGEKNIDGRSDLYALGAIVFQMLTGKFPYEADTPMGLVVKHITEPPPHILEAKPDLPAECEELIQKAMAKNRDERYSTANGMAAALTTIAAGAPSQPATASVQKEAAREKTETEHSASEKLEQERIARVAARQQQLSQKKIESAKPTPETEQGDQKRLARKKATALQQRRGGAEPPVAAVCPRCNAAIDPGDIFCSNCGANVPALLGIEIPRMVESEASAREAVEPPAPLTEEVPLETVTAPRPMRLAGQLQLLEEYRTNGGSVERVALSPDKAWLAAGAASQLDDRGQESLRDTTLYVWRYGKAESPEWEIEMSASVWEVAFSPEGKELASLSEDGSLEIMQVGSLESLGLVRLPQYSCGLEYSSDGTLLAVGAGDEVAIFRPGLKQRRTLKPELGSVDALAFAPQGLLAVSGSKPVIRFWELQSLQQPSGELRGHKSLAEQLSLNPKYPALAAACGKSATLIWNLGGDLTTPRTLRGHPGEVGAVCFSPDGEWLATGGDELVLLWDWRAEKIIGHINLQGTSVSTLIFSPGGERLISGSDDGVARVWKIS